MKKLIFVEILFACFFLGACASHNISEANLKLVAINKYKAIANLSFRSDVDFFSALDKKSGLSLGFPSVQCALTNDLDFTPGHEMPFSTSGSLERNKVQSGEGYIYHSNMWFVLSEKEKEKKIKTGLINGVEYDIALKKMILDRVSIPCRVVMTIVYADPYFSKILYVPSEKFYNAYFDR